MQAESLKHEFAVSSVAKKIKMPAERWAGNCYLIASQMVKKGIIKGKPRYGHWLGPVSEKSLFHKRALVHHGWVECEDEVIVDPTRFEFEGVQPYIYVGENDYYDIGGQVFAKLNMKLLPEFDNSERVNVNIDAELEYFLLSDLLNKHPYLTKAGLFWIANLPRECLGLRIKEIYQMLEKIRMKAAIPIDSYRLVMNG